MCWNVVVSRFFFLEMEYAPASSFCSLWSKIKNKKNKKIAVRPPKGRPREAAVPSLPARSWVPGKVLDRSAVPSQGAARGLGPGIFARRLEPASQRLRSLQRCTIVSGRVRGAWRPWPSFPTPVHSLPRRKCARQPLRSQPAQGPLLPHP